MKERSKVITLLIIIVISGICLSYGFSRWEENYFNVPGTVIGKAEFIKSRRSRSEWVLAIKPDDNKYKPYDVSVDFSTYSAYNVGSHVGFKVMRSKVDPNGHDDFLSILFTAIGLIGIFVAVCLIYDLFHQ